MLIEVDEVNEVHKLVLVFTIIAFQTMPQLHALQS